MYWSELDKRKHSGKRIKVWADSTPDNPADGEGPFEGKVQFNGEMPFLNQGTHVHNFAWWWKVEILD